jgi:hypothetical protein
MFVKKLAFPCTILKILKLHPLLIYRTEMKPFQVLIFIKKSINLNTEQKVPFLVFCVCFFFSHSYVKGTSNVRENSIWTIRKNTDIVHYRLNWMYAPVVLRGWTLSILLNSFPDYRRFPLIFFVFFLDLSP